MNRELIFLRAFAAFAVIGMIFITSTAFEKKGNQKFSEIDVERINIVEKDGTATEGVVFAFDKTGKKHILNFQTLKELELHLDPSEFFRLNRSQVISRQYIEKLERVSKNTLAVKMKGYQELLVASQSNTPQLREWIDQ
jgi:DNA-binding LytR/AlgR family response regulator